MTLRRIRFAVLLAGLTTLPAQIELPKAAAQEAMDLPALQQQTRGVFQQGNYADALAAQRGIAAEIEKIETAESGRPGPKTAAALGEVAFYALAARKFAEALTASERAHELAPDLVWVETNRAHALLLTGRADEAKQLFLSHKGIKSPPDTGKYWEELIEEDFEFLRGAGIEHESFNEVIKSLGIDTSISKDQLRTVHDQGVAFYKALRTEEAVPLAEQYVSLMRKRYSSESVLLASSMRWLAHIYTTLGQYANAEPLLETALGIVEKSLRPDEPEVGDALNPLGELYRAQGRYAEAERLHERCLVLRERALGANHPQVGQSLNNLAQVYVSQGRYAEAEPVQKRALVNAEVANDALNVATALRNLGGVYRAQGRDAEAAPLYERSLELREKALGPDHPEVARATESLALAYSALGVDVDQILQRSLALLEKALGPDHPDVATSLTHLATEYEKRSRHVEAEPLFKRSLAIREKALGPDHPHVASSLNNLSVVYELQGRYVEAEALHKRGLALYEKTLGVDHPLVSNSLGNLAALSFVQRDWAAAADYWRRSTSIVVRNAQRGTDDVGRVLTGKKKAEAQQQHHRFWGLIKVVHRLGSQDDRNTTYLREMFEIAQWSQASETAGSLAKMAARGAGGDTKLATVVRERQDLVEEWQRRDALRTAVLAQSPDKRDRVANAANIERLAGIDARLADIDKRLVAEFPDYAALARPTPLSVKDVQAQLGPSEALVLFLDTDDRFKPITPEETFIWVVTKTDMRWVRSDLGTDALKREVAALRCGLDASMWDDDNEAARCRDLLKTEPERTVTKTIPYEKLPFDAGRAHSLYRALFAQIEDLIRGKHLLIVPSGALTQLPFQALVSAQVNSKNMRAVAWLARKHAITVLPGVSSLKALRRVAQTSIGTKPMLGIGNPLLDGDETDAVQVAWARMAREKQTCLAVSGPMATHVAKNRSAAKIVMRGGYADLAHLRLQIALPDTADELCKVAAQLNLSKDDVLLGAKATETVLKGMNLAEYRVLHFATHGYVAGSIEGASEPGLAMTPPDQQSDLDDGYLSASEVAALKLDADWVILSACNTAAGGAQGAEALSGLARAFIYAGARALLVSHWSVDSAATVKLITAAVGAINRNNKLGRAEALRRAMVTLVDKGELREAHPAFWAPFIVVGEGAAR